MDFLYLEIAELRGYQEVSKKIISPELTGTSSVFSIEAQPATLNWGIISMHFFLYYILPFLVVLGVLIFFHELGHFLTAKAFGVKVLKFSLGFGPKLIWRTMGETEYAIRFVPLGGFVKMLGEDVEEEENLNLPPEDLERAFHKQPVLMRMAIVGAGPVFNLVLALITFFGLYLLSGLQVMTPEVGQVTEGSPAFEAGIRKGDMIVAIQGEQTREWAEIKGLIHDKAGQPLEIIVERANTLVSMTVTPKKTVVKNAFGEEVPSSIIGIVAAGKMVRLKMGPWGAFKEAVLATTKWVKLTGLVIVKLFQGVISVKTIGGPILIGQMTGQLAEENIGYLIPFVAIISINLAVLNLLPIPILDGGMIIFLLMELILRKPLSLATREWALKIGLFLLILLMVVVTYNDLTRIELFQRLLTKIFG